MSEKEQKVFDALADSRWDWRTIDGLKRSTGLPGAEILDVILSNRSKIDFELVPRQENLLFRLKGKPRTNSSILDGALDFLSLGARERVM